MQTVRQYALDDIPLEQVGVIESVGGNEVKMIGIEVRFDSHLPPPLPLGLSTKSSGYPCNLVYAPALAPV
jgi:hypothetical protein